MSGADRRTRARRPPGDDTGDAGVTGGNRAQAYTLEGVSAAILVLLASLFTMQAVLLTPTTPGTIDREARAELATQADDVLTASAESGSLSRAVRYWDDRNGTFYNYSADDTTVCGDPDTSVTVDRELGYGQDSPPCEFGEMMEQTFEQRGFSYNVYVEFRADGGDTAERDRVVVLRQGVPTDNAVSASQTVTLFDDGRLTTPAAGDDPLGETGFYAGDVADGELYNVLRVRVVIW